MKRITHANLFVCLLLVLSLGCQESESPVPEGAVEPLEAQLPASVQTPVPETVVAVSGVVIHEPESAPEGNENLSSAMVRSLEPDNDENLIVEVGEGLYLTHTGPDEEVNVPPPAVTTSAGGGPDELPPPPEYLYEDGVE